LPKFHIACISCPTLFKTLNFYLHDANQQQLTNLIDINSDALKNIDIKLFEYDKRFEIYGENFIFYDYKKPLELTETLFNKFDMIISDPPYLSDECHVKTGMTVKKIGKENCKLIICTGEFGFCSLNSI
jgi:EEF1A lysine methyltransferase 1